ncbi:hypothetical protein NQ317_006577 [Molorchus minor]|uniref:Uncharacterized protein n=1 Tax=Molorchus minor TaxID=1323400 RepID=A0ABQ9K184_9CUCU|nr:hypothetical protein NQ317_006577 [Molorchus minor]
MGRVFMDDSLCSVFAEPEKEPGKERYALREALPQILAVGVKNVLLLGFGMTLGFPTILIPSLSGNDKNEKISLGEDAISWIARQSIAWLRGWVPIDSIEVEFEELSRQIDLGKMTEFMKIIVYHHFVKIFVIMFGFLQRKLLLGLVGSYAYVIDINDFDSSVNGTQNTTSYSALEMSLSQQYAWVPTTFLVLSAFLSYAGIKILPWILTGEVYYNEIRATASGLSGGIGYIFGFTTNKIFFSLVSCLSLPGVFWFYGSVGLVGTIVLYFLLPETEGKTLFEITEHFAGNSKLRNSIRRKKRKPVNGQTNEGFVLEIATVQNETVTLTYVAEVTTPGLRGVLASTSTIAIISGILLQFLLGTFLKWRIVAPYWLILHNRLEEAQKSLAWLRGWVDPNSVETEFKQLFVATYAYLINVQYFDTNLDMKKENKTEVSVIETHNWIPMTFLIGDAFCTHAGIRSLPWMLVGEVYSNETRATASGISGAVSYIFGFLSNKIFFVMVSYMTLPGNPLVLQ